MAQTKQKKGKTGKYKESWDLSLLYRSHTDPRIEHDVRVVERAYEKFAHTYRDVNFTATPTALAKALTAYEKLASMPESARPFRYFMFRQELDARDEYAEKELNKLSDRLTRAANALLFFELRIGAISKNKQRAYLKDPELASFRYQLECIFKDAEHLLSEPEEKILSLKSLPAHGLWVSGMEKILNRYTIKRGKEEESLQNALSMLPRLTHTQRRNVWKNITDGLQDLGEVAENELNAVVLNKKINDELRGYEKPYTATVLGYENDVASIEALVDTVSTKGFALSWRYYKLNAKLLKQEKMEYVDRLATVGKNPEVSFSDSVAFLREVFPKVNPEYGNILDRMLANGQIDVYPKKGKTGGAFCASATHLPTFVLLNHTNTLNSLTTFAHEMGHAVHSERSKEQPVRYEDYSTATAETASTLFEGLVFEHVVSGFSKREQFYARLSKMDDFVASVVRQIAFFNFEKEMHETIRIQGAMTHDELATCMQKHLASYMGPAVRVNKADGYSFVYVSHFRNFFYVYTYAYGQLISNVIAKRWIDNPAYAEEIDRFLTAGGSMSPEDIFKGIGIDTSNPVFFEEGLASAERELKMLEEYTRTHLSR